MPLSEQALQAIKTDSDLRAKLMLVPCKKNGKGASEYTIKRWLDDNSDNLTKPKYTVVIAQHTGLALKEILEA